MKKLVFADTEEFYQKLLECLKSGTEIEIITDYKRFSDLPPRLKQIFELEYHRTGVWTNAVTGVFIPSSIAPVSLNLKALIVLASTAMGAGIGGFFGLIPGAIIGSAIGLAAGTVSAILLDNKHRAEVQIDPHGRFHIKVCGN